MGVMTSILTKKKKGEKSFALLIDVDKYESIPYNLSNLSSQPDFIFVGGSTKNKVPPCVEKIKLETNIPVVLFPGNSNQFDPSADAILFHTLLSHNKLSDRFQEQMTIAQPVFNSKMEVIPMGYILIDGGNISSVQKVSAAQPVQRSDMQTIKTLAIMAQLLGKHIIYLEAGSGATIPINTSIIKLVSSTVSLPIIVGGGICSKEKIVEDFNAGADIVVVGNFLESHPYQISNFCDVIAKYNKKQR